MNFAQYDTVKILEVSGVNESAHDVRSPSVGDIGTIVEIYHHPELGYHIECCEDDGSTKWLEVLKDSETKLEVLSGKNT